MEGLEGLLACIEIGPTLENITQRVLSSLSLLDLEVLANFFLWPK